MSSAASRPNLLPVAAFVSLLVLLLGVTGLFALHHTNQKTAADLARVNDAEETLVLTLRTRAAFKTQVQEWKNILLRGRNPDDLATYRTRFDAEEKLVRGGLEKLGTHPAMPESGALVAEHHKLAEAYRAALAAFDPADPASSIKADGAVRGLDRPLSDKLDSLAAEVEKIASDELASMSARAAARYEALRRITWIVASLAVLASLWLCVRATRVTS